MAFKGKVFVVTGANSGIGFAAAEHLVNEGAKVYITGRNAAAVQEAAGSLGPRVVGVVADAASIADSVRLADTILRNGDEVDGLFINAGIAKFMPFETIDEVHYDELFNTNLKGAFFCIQKLLPVLKDGSSIVLNASIAAHVGSPASSVYGATKAGVNSLAKTLSRDLLPRKIRVNVVNPGFIHTPAFGKMGLPAAVLDEVTKGMAAQIPLGRIGHVDEITGYVAFLLSDKSTFILGTELSIDGGFSQL